MGFHDVAVWGFVFDEFPIAVFDRPHAGFAATGVGTIKGVAHGRFLAFEDGFEAEAFVGLWRGDSCEVAEGGEDVEEVDVAFDAGSGLDAWSFDDEGHAPGVLVEVLFAHETMAANGDAVIGGVEDVGIVQFASLFELF